MTTYSECDDCHKWVDSETMDIFFGGLFGNTKHLCPHCSEKRRAQRHAYITEKKK